MMALLVSIKLKLLTTLNIFIFYDHLYLYVALTLRAKYVLKATIREKSSTGFYRILPILSLLSASTNGYTLTVRLS